MLKYINKWGVCNFTNTSIHPKDFPKWDDYPFQPEWHKCIGIEKEYLQVRFAGIILRILPIAFRIIDNPDFLPFENIKYYSSKNKLEFGRMIGYGSLWKPIPHRVYLLEVKGKKKTTLYKKERLEKVKTKNLSPELDKIVSLLLNEYYMNNDSAVDENRWLDVDLLLKRIKIKFTNFKHVKYHDIILMSDESPNRKYQLKTVRNAKKYKWYIKSNF